MNLSLFDISTEFYVLKDLIENDLEINEETGEIIDNSMELKQLFDDLKMTLEEKLDNTQRYLLTLDGEADILDKEINRLQSKKQSILNKKDRLKNIVISTLENTGLGKIKTSLFSFNIRETESIEIVDFDSLGRNFLRLKKEADKKAIKEAIKNGEVVEGAKIVKNKSLGVR